MKVSFSKLTLGIVSLSMAVAEVHQPSGSFNLNIAGQAVTDVKYFGAGRSKLYFVASKGPRSVNATLFVTGLLGEDGYAVSLPPDEVRGLAVTEDESVTVLLSGDQQDTLIFCKERKCGNATPVAGRWNAIKRLRNGALLGLSLENGAAQFRIDNGRGGFRSVPISVVARRPLLVELAGGGLALVDRNTGVVHFLTADGLEAISPVKPTAPDLTWADSASPPPGKMVRVVFSGAAAAPDGTLLLRISHYRLGNGAPLLRLGTHGEVLGTERFFLPTDAALKDPDNPGGYEIPLLMDVSGNQLYFVTSSGKIIFYGL